MTAGALAARQSAQANGPEGEIAAPWHSQFVGGSCAIWGRHWVGAPPVCGQRRRRGGAGCDKGALAAVSITPRSSV